ncbi:hypothetical protein XENORESO_008921 [Xenotaenia resolanae]|uniref:Uncharacterized protein n=1 Tax=Xenotaenia resolanae TaxID=208358 RepID=A0ABV0WXD2_9TELE
MMKKEVLKRIAAVTCKGFPCEITHANKNRLNPPHFVMSSASAVDVKQYNYALIYCIVALSMHEFHGIQREDSLPPLPLLVSLSPSLFLRFSSFMYLNVSYVCVGCWDCAVLMYSLTVFLFSS